MSDNIVSIDEKELEQAKEEAKDAKSLYTLTFKKPLEYDGETYTELKFDFDSLTGQDSLLVERELTRAGVQLVVPGFNGDYLIRMAVRACTADIGNDIVKRMTLRDYSRLRSAMRNFLMASES